MPQIHPKSANPVENSLSSMISKPILVRVDGIIVRGTLLTEDPVTLSIKGNDGSVTVVVKNKVSMYRACELEQPPVEAQYPLFVLACTNPEIRCRGVRFIKKDKPAEDSDYALFMSDCPFKRDTCKHGCIGEWGQLPRKAVSDLLGSTILGEYPTSIPSPVQKMPEKKGE